MRQALVPLLAASLLAPALAAQGTRLLELEELSRPSKKVDFAQTRLTRLGWLEGGALQETRVDPATRAVSLLQVDPKTWASKPLLEADKLKAALVAAGAPEADAKAALGAADFHWNADRSAFVLDIQEDLFLVDLKAGAARRLTTAPGTEDEPSFSPDGSRVAFLRGNDLYVVTTADAKETRLTTGGDATHFHGRLDWVYQEELYGRYNFKGFWWSPDSKRIAYLDLDESQVPAFTIMDDREVKQRPLVAKYPRSGEPNPIARLGVVAAEGGATTWMADPYAGQETLIVQVGWTPKGQLEASLQDRVQTWLDLVRYEGTAAKSFLKEQSRAWQERLPLPVYLKDGSFLWESDRSGFHHLYRYSASGQLLNAVTQGDWDVKEIHGVDEKSGRVFFSGTRRSPIGQDAYAVKLGGGEPTQLTQARGTHRVSFNADFSAFLDSWSDAVTPPKQALFDIGGRQLRLIDENPSPKLKELKLGAVKFQSVKTRDGFAMESELILPPDFDPAKKYPVVQHIYGGPAAPQAVDAWSRNNLWYQFLAQHGYVVWICDNRSASAKGNAAFGIWHHFGLQELQDQLDGLAWLKQQGWADMDRVCMEGWSYGGYMTSFALTHSRAWKLGIIGAPVTDWHLYDSIYTERYMGLPKDNAAGYDLSSVSKAAKDFHGKAIIIQGTVDDNVHPQNVTQFIDRLQKDADTTLPLYMLPGSDHSPRAAQHAWIVQKTMWDFISGNL